MRLLLLDKTAYVRGTLSPDPEDELCVCAVTCLELLHSARSRDDYARLEADLAEFRELGMDAETFGVARGAQRDLAKRGHPRVAIPDLLIAACAQQHGAGVLHVDRRFDVLATVLSFAAVRAG